MSYALIIASEHRPEDVPGWNPHPDIWNAADHGADVVAMWADRVVTTKADRMRWRDILMSGEPLDFDDEDGEPWRVQVRKVTA